MAIIVVKRGSGDTDICRRAFARAGAFQIGTAKGGDTVTYSRPGVVEIQRADFARVFPWAPGAMPKQWQRLADGARAAGSKVIEFSRDRLVIGDAAVA